MLLGATAAVATVLGSAAAAQANSTLPAVALDSPGNGNPPLVAYDPGSATTYVAWTANPTNSGIDLCVLASGSSSCKGGAPVLLTDSQFSGDSVPILTGLRVMPNGEVVVVGLAAGSGTVTWASAPGGAAFLTGTNGLQNSGQTISEVSNGDQPDNVVPVSDTGLAILDGTDDNRFGAFPYDVAGTSTGEAADGTAEYSDRPAFTEDAPQIASVATPGVSGDETVVTAGSNDNSNSQTTPPGCPSVNAVGFGVRVAAPASLNSAPVPDYQLLACSAMGPVLVSGGGSGIGVVEQEGSGVAGTGSDFQIDFRPFDATSTGGSFGAPVELSDETTEALGGVDALDATEDSGSGVYAIWEDNRGAVLDYSANGGTTWGPPVATPDPYGADENIAAIGGGTALVAYDTNASGAGTQVFVQQVSYQSLLPGVPVPAATTTTTTQTSGGAHGADITVAAGTVGETDRATIAGTNASSATGTVKYELYSNASCTASTAVFAGGFQAVSGGVAAASAAVTKVLAPGKYYWQATYSGDAANQASITPCGSEVLTVAPAPSGSGTGSTNGTTVIGVFKCVLVPCRITVLMTVAAPGPSKVHPLLRGKKTRAKTVTLVDSTVTIRKSGSRKLTLKLSKAGRSYFRSHHGTVKTTMVVSDRVDGHTERTTRTVRLSYVKPKAKRR